MDATTATFIRSFLDRLSLLSDGDWNFVAPLFKQHSLAKSECLYRPGDEVKKVIFVEKGMLRLYQVQNGKEHTRNFFGESSFFTESVSYFSSRPTEFYLQALEDSQLWTLTYAETQKIFDHSMGLSRLGRKILEWNLAGLAERLVQNMEPSPDDKYSQLRDTRPELFQRVPQYMIASYIGLSPEALSRVISRSRHSS